MKVVVIGNIGAGKTTMANLILKKYKHAKYISIDNIRKKYGDGTKEKEEFCKIKFIESVKINENFQVIELSGVGELGEQLFELLDKSMIPILVINLVVYEKEIIERIKDRKWDTPFPLRSDNISVAVKYTEEIFNEGLMERLIHKCQQAIFLSLLNTNLRLMERNIKIILNNISLIIKLNKNVQKEI